DALIQQDKSTSSLNLPRIDSIIGGQEAHVILSMTPHKQEQPEIEVFMRGTSLRLILRLLSSLGLRQKDLKPYFGTEPTLPWGNVNLPVDVGR
ncbi:hypothetical protein A2U01_0022711, partial [Trifolium medium]|nr:hypothetical protein [Trifolium medium]